MYIIAKKKDYYDGVAGTTGIDKTIVYDRQIVELRIDEIPKIFGINKSFWGISYKETPFRKLSYHSLKGEYKNICDEHAFFIIGFCGKLYIGWKLYKEVKYGWNEISDKITTTITYDMDYIKTILEPKSWHGNLADSIDYIKSYNPLQVFRDLKTPVFVFDSDYDRKWIDRHTYNNHHPKFFINPLLKDYEFPKVFDAFQAFQEIQMFISGVLGTGEKEIVEVADKYKIMEHGFDYKWSFRKEPEAKK
jgi:hypothetical protein